MPKHLRGRPRHSRQVCKSQRTASLAQSHVCQVHMMVNLYHLTIAVYLADAIAFYRSSRAKTVRSKRAPDERADEECPVRPFYSFLFI